MAYAYTPEYYNMMTNGSLVTAVDTLLTDKTGGFWYILLFGTPLIMVWMKTGSIALPTALTMWSIVMYGHLMGVDNILGVPLTIFIVLGLASIAMKFLGPFR